MIGITFEQEKAAFWEAGKIMEELKQAGKSVEEELQKRQKELEIAEQVLKSEQERLEKLNEAKNQIIEIYKPKIQQPGMFKQYGEAIEENQRHVKQCVQNIKDAEVLIAEKKLLFGELSKMYERQRDAQVRAVSQNEMAFGSSVQREQRDSFIELWAEKCCKDNLLPIQAAGNFFTFDSLGKRQDLNVQQLYNYNKVFFEAQIRDPFTGQWTTQEAEIQVDDIAIRGNDYLIKSGDKAITKLPMWDSYQNKREAFGLGKLEHNDFLANNSLESKSEHRKELEELFR